MLFIPGRCPKCGSKTQWKEVINPFTPGIPLGNHIRISIFHFGGLAKMFRGKIQYRCYQCGFSKKY